MQGAEDIADSTDWLDTPLHGLSPLENALHCQICKEFFDTPMITTCCHTFCSKCIRTSLSTDGCCPACRSQDQPSKLRNNWQVQELVTTFLAARPATLKTAREYAGPVHNGSLRPGKRKRSTVEQAGSTADTGGRSTRSKSRRMESSEVVQADPVLDSESDFGDEEAPSTQQDDGLIECPLGCGKRMIIEQIEPHLDRCEDERKARDKAAAQAKARMNDRAMRERLAELNYSMMKEKDLAKKMKELGIPVWGSKQLMMRRHTAWVNIWNANCDSSTPRAKGQLVRELEVWERTQGGSAHNQDQGVMKKEFDGSGWAKNNSDDFTKLIQDARKSRMKVMAKIDESKSIDQREGGLASPQDDTLNLSVTKGLSTHSPDAKAPDGLSVGTGNSTALEHSHTRLGPATIPDTPVTTDPDGMQSQMNDNLPLHQLNSSDLVSTLSRSVTTKTPMFASRQSP